MADDVEAASKTERNFAKLSLRQIAVEHHLPPEVERAELDLVIGGGETFVELSLDDVLQTGSRGYSKRDRAR
jgi:hypothetical protein